MSNPMPTELGNLQVQIMSDMILLHIQWKLYRQLFGSSSTSTS